MKIKLTMILIAYICSSFKPLDFVNLSFLGDSITAGYLLSNVNDRYSTQTCAALGVTEVNGGISSSTLTVAGGNNPGVNRYQTYIRSNGKYVVYIGINDVTRCTNQQYQDALTTVVTGLLGSYSPQDIILCNLEWTGDGVGPSFTQHQAFNEIIQSTATDYGTKFCDFYSLTYQHPEYYISNPPDVDYPLHPNAVGATAMKNTLISVLNQTPIKTKRGKARII
jgi:lysophospholipase L1-like esterase